MSPPPKKRQRVKAPDVNNEVGRSAKGNAKTGTAATPSLEEIDAQFDSLLQDSSDRNQLQSSLLQLAEWQRSLYATIASQEAELTDLRNEKLRAKNLAAAAEYEKAFLKKQIVACKSFETPHLEKLATEEVHGEQSNVINVFLDADVHNPRDKAQILLKLQGCLKQRKALAKDVTSKQQALAALQATLKTKQDFLKALPAQVTAMERASTGLVKVMQNSGTNSIQHMSGKARLERLQLAQELPAPLYTLFSLLQRTIDELLSSNQQSQDDASDTNKIRLNVVAKPDSTQEVVLQLPVPDGSNNTSSSKKRVSIHFQYESTPVPVVTVNATGCNTALNQDILLDELFPGDVGESLSKSNAKAYVWCNQIAGLYVVNQSSGATTTIPWNSTARVVLYELQRRIRANAALKHILHSLQRHHVPAGSSSSISSSFAPPVCVLASFVEAKETAMETSDKADTSVRSFKVELRKGGKSLKVTVSIDMVRYPAVPPVWTIPSDNSDDKERQLYNDSLAKLQCSINGEALENVATDHEWILVHQLRMLMHYFDDEHNGEAMGGSARKRRGRDRRETTSSM